VLRVGDAASFVDPLSSYGIKKALASAWLAAVVVNTVLADPAMADPATELYAARERAMYQALSRQSALLANGAEGHADRFWEARMDAGDATGPSPDRAPTSDSRTAERTRAAFAELKRLDRFALHASSALRTVLRPVVEGDRIALRGHLVGAGLAEPVRYLHNVDVVELVGIAPHHEDVASLYAAYKGAAGAVPFPDFLAALSTLLGTDALTLV
jgi:hypothetical protein